MSGPARVRVMSWNIHGGTGPDGRFDLDRIAALIRRWDPDIVALQEVDSRRGTENDLTAFGFLVANLGLHSIEAKSIAAKDGDYGQLLISRWALDRVEIHDISHGSREPRRAIDADIATPAGPLHVIATHLGLGFGERRAQARSLCRIAEGSTGATIVLGDFNDWLPNPIRRALAAEFPARTRHRTFPARWPLMKLDRVFCRPADLLAASRTDPAAALISDHLPVIADLVLPEG